MNTEIIMEAHRFCQQHTKFLCNIFLSRLTPYVKEITRYQHFEFRHNRSNAENILCTTKYFTKIGSKWKSTSTSAIKNAYDSVRTMGLHNILIELGIPIQPAR